MTTRTAKILVFLEWILENAGGRFWLCKNLVSLDNRFTEKNGSSVACKKFNWVVTNRHVCESRDKIELIAQRIILWRVLASPLYASTNFFVGNLMLYNFCMRLFDDIINIKSSTWPWRSIFKQEMYIFGAPLLHSYGRFKLCWIILFFVAHTMLNKFCILLFLIKLIVAEMLSFWNYLCISHLNTYVYALCTL